MDKQTFVLSIVKHFICDKITKGECPKATLADEKICEDVKKIACKACKIYDSVSAHVAVHDKRPDGNCHTM